MPRYHDANVPGGLFLQFNLWPVGTTTMGYFERERDNSRFLPGSKLDRARHLSGYIVLPFTGPCLLHGESW